MCKSAAAQHGAPATDHRAVKAVMEAVMSKTLVELKAMVASGEVGRIAGDLQVAWKGNEGLGVLYIGYPPDRVESVWAQLKTLKH